MASFLAAGWGLVPFTVNGVVAVGAVTVFLALTFRRLDLALVVTLPVMCLATVHYLASAARHGRPFPWFTAGVAMVGLFFVLALSIIVYLCVRTWRANLYDRCWDAWYEAGGVDEYPPYPQDPDDPQPGDSTPGDGTDDGFIPFSGRPRRRGRPDDNDGLCGRLAAVTRDFLSSIREGRPVRLDAGSKEALWLLDALIPAVRTVADEKDRHRARLRAAVRETELRWDSIRHGRPDDDGTNGSNIPGFEPF